MGYHAAGEIWDAPEGWEEVEGAGLRGHGLGAPVGLVTHLRFL